MPAKILDGKKASEALLSRLKAEISTLPTKPALAIVSIGDDAASGIYVRKKIQACEKTGIEAKLHRFPENTPEADIISLLQGLNMDDSISGIIVQLPLPKHISPSTLQSVILPLKDADGFCIDNLGLLAAGKPRIEPATPAGIMHLLDFYKIKLQGKHAVIIGRSNIVGKPVAQLLLQRDCTITIAHSKTRNLGKLAKQADILIAAVGKAKLVKKPMVKKGAIVIDVGINRVGGKLAGDVDFQEVSKVAGAITPVPGGVGPMTVASLMANTVKCYKLLRM